MAMSKELKVDFLPSSEPWSSGEKFKVESSLTQSPVWSYFVDIMTLQHSSPSASSEDGSSTYSSSISMNTSSTEDLQSVPVSLSFLEADKGGEEVLLEDTIAIYSRHPSQIVGRDALFYIESDVNVGTKGKLPVQILSPTGATCLAFAMADKFQQGRLTFSFRPQQPGRHIVFVADISGKRPLYEFSSSRDYTADPESIHFASISTNGHSSPGKAWGIAVHLKTNTIYIADRDNHQIVVLSSTGKFLRHFGKQGHRDDQLFRPTGLAIHEPTGKLFITDKDNHRVAIYTLDGSFIQAFGRKGYKNGEFNYPWGVATSPKDDLVVVADSRNHRLQMFNTDGEFLRKFSVFETNPFEFKGLFNYPRGVAFSPDGQKIYVTDFNIHTVFILDVNLEKKTTLVEENRLQRPQGLIVDQVGNVLVADSKNDCVRVVSPTGVFIETIQLSGRHDFQMPMDIALLNNGKIVVTDKENRLRIF